MLLRFNFSLAPTCRIADLKKVGGKRLREETQPDAESSAGASICGVSFLRPQHANTVGGNVHGLAHAFSASSFGCDFLVGFLIYLV